MKSFNFIIEFLIFSFLLLSEFWFLSKSSSFITKQGNNILPSFESKSDWIRKIFWICFGKLPVNNIPVKFVISSKKLHISWYVPGSPFLPALPKACSSTLSFLGIKVRQTCNPLLLITSLDKLISVPLPAKFVAIMILQGFILSYNSNCFDCSAFVNMWIFKFAFLWINSSLILFAIFILLQTIKTTLFFLYAFKLVSIIALIQFSGLSNLGHNCFNFLS